MKSWYLILAIILSLVLSFAVVVACGDDDDDDDDDTLIDDDDATTDDDATADDDAAGDDDAATCTETDICEFVVPECNWFTDVDACEADYLEACGGNAGAFLACACGCLAAADSCDNWEPCEIGCWELYCD